MSVHSWGYNRFEHRPVWFAAVLINFRGFADDAQPRGVDAGNFVDRFAHRDFTRRAVIPSTANRARHSGRDRLLRYRWRWAGEDR